MVLETQMTLRVTEPDFFRKSSFAQTLKKCVKIGSKIEFFEFILKISLLFLLNLFCNENLYYLLCFCE